MLSKVQLRLCKLESSFLKASIALTAATSTLQLYYMHTPLFYTLFNQFPLFNHLPDAFILILP